MITALLVWSVSSDLREKVWNFITSSLGQSDFHSKQAENISYEKALIKNSEDFSCLPVGHTVVFIILFIARGSHSHISTSNSITGYEQTNLDLYQRILTTEGCFLDMKYIEIVINKDISLVFFFSLMGCSTICQTISWYKLM